MALIRCQFFSEVLSLSSSMTVILPQQTKGQIGMQNNKTRKSFPTLYLLHGFSDDDTIWTRRTSIERYAAEYGIAVVMPNVDHSFYTDMVYGKKYWTFLSEELPNIAHSFFPLSDKREDTFVAGLSMGGYGALKWALRCPDKFAAVASLSGVTDIVSHLEKVRTEDSITSGPLSLVFGDKKVKGTDDDLFTLVEQLKATPSNRPRIYQACGTEDFLFDDNVSFLDKCKKEGVTVTSEFEPGDHHWEYWDRKIKDVLKWLPITK